VWYKEVGNSDWNNFIAQCSAPFYPHHLNLFPGKSYYQCLFVGIASPFVFAVQTLPKSRDT